ncbi:1-deoxyxylulose-5-phosphate synthase YajO-like isoform X2 [Littorina saxatilis]|uniref:1-deoxyxylulose-5-phosphate synthase YajO-like isoform X2 n=1 Tax=Littorina saxatilis TaxID=31220 RepID=UPI0038B43948
MISCCRTFVFSCLRRENFIARIVLTSVRTMASEIPEESKCQNVYLGKSGLRVSNICLGTLTFGESNMGQPGQLDEAGSHALLNRFSERGGNFIDTANVYGRGRSERIIGSWLASQQRDRFVIATKVFFPMDRSNPNSMGLGRRHIMDSVEQSLKRLKTDYIDLLQTHVWDDATPLEETLMTMNDLVRSGKVRYVGASNVTGWQLQRIVELNKQMGFNACISLQQYSLVCRESEQDTFQACKLNGVGVLPWSPLKGGFLTGKVRRGQKPQEGRLAWSADDDTLELQSAPTWAQLNKTTNWTALEAAEKIAKAKGKSVAQVSLRWLLQKSVVSSVIIGATKMHQLDDNMDASNGWTLSEEEMRQLDEASQPEIPYPYELIRRLNVRRNNPWNATGYV